MEMSMDNLHLALSIPTHDFAIARIDEQIISLKSQLHKLYSQRNSLSFICRLPTETLETIFIYCARDYYLGDSGELTLILPGWVNISYVCRHWRNTALNCPTLWTYLFAVSPRWTEELLARSRHASLKIHLDLGFMDKTYEASHFLDEVMIHVKRIQQLDLNLPGTRTDEILHRLCSSAPHLKTLKISVYDICPHRSWILFDGDTPALRELELTRSPVPWYTFKSSGLTILSLHDIPDRHRHDMKYFLPTLCCMQSLVQLDLEDALASADGFLSSADFHVSEKINLPHLSRLLIAAPLSTVIAFLSCVHIPSRTKVRLECHEEDVSLPDAYAILASLLAQRLGTFQDPRPSSPTIRSLVLDTFGWGKAIFAFSASERDYDFGSHVEWDRDVPLRIMVGFSPSTSRSDGDRIMRDICCAVPPTHLHTFHVLDPPRSSAFWTHTLGHLRELRYLKLSSGDMPDLALILAIPPGHCAVQNQAGHADPGPDRVFVPALEELELYGILLSTAAPTNDPQSLYDALSSRKESRGRLVISQCAVTATYTDCERLDLVGRWEGGQFHIVDST